MDPAAFRTIDPYPLEGAQYTRLHPYYAALREGRLVTTRCPACAQTFWPPRLFCPECAAGDLPWVDLPRQGTVHAFSIQEAGVPPGFTPPLIFAVVALAGHYIFTRLVDTPVDQVRLGLPVEATTLKIPDAPYDADRVLLAFKPAT